MVTLEDIELDILADTDAGKSAVDNFREILDVIGFKEYSVDQIDLIFQVLEPLLPIAEELDHVDKDAWSQWATTVSKVRAIFQELYALTPLENRKNRPISAENNTLISALSAKTGFSISGFVPVKAILLIGCYRHYLYKKYVDTKFKRACINTDIGDLKFAINFCARYPAVNQKIAEEYLPEWTHTSSPALWEESFLEKTSSLPATSAYKFIHTIRQILVIELGKNVNSTTSKQENILATQPIPIPSPAQNISAKTQFDEIEKTIPADATSSETSVVTPEDWLDKNGKEEKTFSILGIVKIIRGGNPSFAEKTTVGNFREILMVLSFGECPVDQLDLALQSVESLLPIAKDLGPRYTDVWSRWTVTIQKVRAILRESFPSASQNTWRGKLKDFPLISCLATEINRKAPSGLLPAKAVALIRFYAKLVEKPSELENYSIQVFYVINAENNLADTIRKCCTLKWKHSDLAQEYLPDWPGPSPAAWMESFIKKSANAPVIIPIKYHPRSDKHDFIHTMSETLGFASNIVVNTPPSEPDYSAEYENSLAATPPHGIFDDIKITVLADTAAGASEVVTERPVDSPSSQQDDTRKTEPIPSQEQNHSVVIQPATNNYSRSGRKHSVRPSFNLFPKQKVNVDADAEGIEPDIAHVVPQQDTPADQPTQLPVIQSLEIRYTNYRTAMDNQRLPWAWDCLNKFEIVVLRQALKDSATLENASVSEKQGAFLVWLMLAIGQSIDQILQLCLTHSANIRGALIFGPVYRKYIQSPPHAFRPSEHEKILLGSHGQFIDLSLAPPFPALFGELGLIDSNVKPNLQYKNIGAYLKLDNAGADKVVRQFLEKHKSRDMRLLPGKIRNVLSAEIMRVAQDPVATHLLSSLPTDMPPAGVYYTSYSEDVLRQIYNQATAQIFGAES